MTLTLFLRWVGILIAVVMTIILPLYFTWDEVWRHPSMEKDWPRIAIFVLFALGSMIALPITIMRNT